jgi:2,4-dienoyl-CoA reductase-like NADH-dependent reductase (Old Yellow Enzyme family)
MRNIGAIKSVAEFTSYVNQIGVSLPFDEELKSGPDSPLARQCALDSRVIGNRFAILPMEGWDSATDGRPTEFTRRRWQRFGLSGAKLIFGGEAAAVRQDGKGSPNQLMITEETVDEVAELRELLVSTHEEHHGSSDDLLVGLQLTHSGRVSKPHDMKRPEPVILYHNPVLDQRFGVTGDTPVMTDEDIARLIEDFIKAARLAQQAGFNFVDVKHCHGYLGHEFLSAVDRPGRYGGSFENRTRFLRETVAGIRSEVPGLDITVRLSAYDLLPFQSGADGRGEPADFGGERYPYAFGGDGTGMGVNLAEPLAFVGSLHKLDIKLVCISAGAGYNAHILRPSFLPSLVGYRPPEDPLMGVARLISVAAELKRQRPELIYVGSGYTYLQQWLPNVAQSVVRNGMADIVGIGRMSLCYPEIITDMLAGRALNRRLLCRTCGDCITAPRNGLISGCYLLDDFYRNRPEYQQLKKLKGKK